MTKIDIIFEKDLKDLIYKSGKGIELQVWDDGTVFCRSVLDENTTAEGTRILDVVKECVDKQK